MTRGGVALVLFVLSCQGASAPDHFPATRQKYPRGADGPSRLDDARCEQACAARAGCGAQPGCTASCSTLWGAFRNEAVEAFLDCLGAGCQADENACVLGIAPLPVHLEYAGKCRREALACGRAEEEIARSCDVESNPWAARYLLYSADAMARALQCLDGTCRSTCALSVPAAPLLR